MKSLIPALLLIGGVVHADLADTIARRAAEVEDEVIAWRRDVHQHPELSNREFRTADLVAGHLESLGIDVTRNVAHTGVVGVLEGARRGKVVALRADMDALPVTERTGLPYASEATGEYLGEEVGVMHACGHDTHVAILMGTASVLAGMREELPGTVKFIFQPAEEGAPPGEEGGARLMVAEGVLDDPKVDAIFGLHISQGQTVGEAAVRSGSMMASSQGLVIRVEGSQTHGARPWAGVDPIVIGSHIVTALQTIVSRNVDVSATPAVVTIGSFRAGVRGNIIPAEAVLRGTIRTFDANVRDDVHRRIRALATQIGDAMGAEVTVEIGEGYPVTYNDPALTERMRPTLERVYGADNVAQSPLIMGAEDFSFFQRVVPGMYFYIGGRPADVPLAEAIPNHSPYFYIDEGALVLAVEAMSNLAVDYLSGR